VGKTDPLLSRKEEGGSKAFRGGGKQYFHNALRRKVATSTIIEEKGKKTGESKKKIKGGNVKKRVFKSKLSYFYLRKEEGEKKRPGAFRSPHKKKEKKR